MGPRLRPADAIHHLMTGVPCTLARFFGGDKSPGCTRSVAVGNGATLSKSYHRATDVIIAGSRMIDAHGERGYLQSWHHPFPTRAFAELRDLWRNSVLL